MAQSNYKKVFFFPIENIKSRYTTQMCNQWMPTAFQDVMGDDYDRSFIPVQPDDFQPNPDILRGVVLDDVGRGLYSLAQTSRFLKMIQHGEVRSGDALFFMDFWTPGIEAVYYAMQMRGIEPEIYSHCHAQSVDEYDFTYPMKEWIRPIEYGYAYPQKAIFVNATILKDQLREGGFFTPIHVVGPEVSFLQIRAMMIKQDRKNQVIFASRIDWEKQPEFMMQVAQEFLASHPDWEWLVTTSRDRFVSNRPEIVDRLYRYANQEPRFKMLAGLSKVEYYSLLNKSKIQFTSSLQDYVSIVLMESCVAGCDICYPDFRSFPECVPADRLYKPWEVGDAIAVLQRCIDDPHEHYNIPLRCDMGRKMVAKIIWQGYEGEYNVWEDQRNAPLQMYD